MARSGRRILLLLQSELWVKGFWSEPLTHAHHPFGPWDFGPSALPVLACFEPEADDIRFLYLVMFHTCRVPSR